MSMKHTLTLVLLFPFVLGSAQLQSQNIAVPSMCADYPCWKDMMEDPNVHVPSAQEAFE